MKTQILVLALIVTASTITAQNVGINTEDPQAKLHVFGEGQVPEPGGLFLFGNKTKAHLVGDVNYLQSNWTDDGTTLTFYLQPNGGDLGINLPSNYFSRAPLHVFSAGESPSANGLAMLGDIDAGNLQLDYNRIQSMQDGTPLTLMIQPEGGNLSLSDGMLYIDQGQHEVGVGTASPVATLDIKSDGNTDATRALRIRNSALSEIMVVKDNGQVGIGTTVPEHTLHVSGEIGVSTQITHVNDDDTFIKMWPDKITMNAGGVELFDITETDGQNTVALGNGYNANIRLNGSALHVGAANDWVGIGTTTPSSRLHVVGSITFADYLIHEGDSDTWVNFLGDEIEMYAGGVKMLEMDEGASDWVKIANGTMTVNGTAGGVGIGVTTPDTELHIDHDLNGGITLENQNNNKWLLHNDVPSNSLFLMYNGDLKGSFNDANGDYSASSDRRLKKNIEDMEPVLDKVNQLSPKTYHFKTQADSDKRNIGFIAQEVLEVFPESVTYSESKDVYGVDYNDFAVVSIQAIQELTEIVKDQQKQIDELRLELESAKSQVSDTRAKHAGGN